MSETTPSPDPRPAATLEAPPAVSTRRRWSRRVEWGCVGLLYVAMIVAQFLPARFADEAPAFVFCAWAAFMLRTFSFHIGIGLCVAVVIRLLLRRRRVAYALVPAAAVLLLAEVHFPRTRPTPGSDPTMRVMSINLLAGNRNVQAVWAAIEQADPDVLALQEYTPYVHEALHERLSARMPHAQWRERRDSFGVALYSRLPLSEVRFCGPLGTEDLPLMRAVIEAPAGPVALYNIHLVPPSSRAWVVEQRREAADLLERLADESLPLIICGDFNFTNNSAFADAFRAAGLVDVHEIAGVGRGATWPDLGLLRHVPGIRLDHIFVAESFDADRSEVGPRIGSDHRPVFADIRRRVER